MALDLWQTLSPQMWTHQKYIVIIPCINLLPMIHMQKKEVLAGWQVDEKRRLDKKKREQKRK